MSKQAGVSRNSLRCAEKGNQVTIGTLERLLDAFGYDLDAIKREDSGDAL
jgi:hypothetical protein